MIIQLIKFYKVTPGTYKGRTIIPEKYAAIQGEVIGIGNTRIEAIENCMENMPILFGTHRVEVKHL